MPSRTARSRRGDSADTGPGFLRAIALFPLRMAWGGLRACGRRLAPWGRSIAVTTGCSAAGGLAWMGMVASLEANPAYRIPIGELSFGALPDWLEPGMAEEAREVAARAAPEASLLDPDLPRRLAEAIEGIDWVHHAIEVRKVHPDAARNLPPRLAIRLAIRRPVARIVQSGREFLIDPEGLRLPRRAYRIESASLPVLLGVAEAPPATGDAWRSEGVHAALGLLREGLGRRIDERYSGFRIAGVDLSGFGNPHGEPDLVLLTPERKGLRFSWGSGPGRPPLAAQFERLEEHLAMEREIVEGMRQPYAPLILVQEYVELRFPRPSFR